MEKSKYTYSFRAECAHDVDEFFRLCNLEQLDLKCVNLSTDERFPDVMVEMESESSGLKDVLVELTRGGVDLHVIRQTLKELPITDNQMKRDYDLG